jgi:hypothetical protein
VCDEARHTDAVGIAQNDVLQGQLYACCWEWRRLEKAVLRMNAHIRLESDEALEEWGFSYRAKLEPKHLGTNPDIGECPKVHICQAGFLLPLPWTKIFLRHVLSLLMASSVSGSIHAP